MQTFFKELLNQGLPKSFGLKYTFFKGQYLSRETLKISRNLLYALLTSLPDSHKLHSSFVDSSHILVCL